MLGVFFIVIGFFIIGLGFGLEGFEDDPSSAKQLQMKFISTGLLIFLVGLVIAVFTL
jgi:hypothetical protein